MVPSTRIARSIAVVRKRRVLLDAELAALYGVETKVLVQAVKRNFERFPPDFMFQLSREETKVLRSQFVTSKSVSRDSTVESPRAIAVNIEIMRVFIRLRLLLTLNK